MPMAGWSRALFSALLVFTYLVHRLRRMVQAGAKRRAALRGSWVNHLSASVH